MFIFLRILTRVLTGWRETKLRFRTIGTVVSVHLRHTCYRWWCQREASESGCSSSNGRLWPWTLKTEGMRAVFVSLISFLPPWSLLFGIVWLIIAIEDTVHLSDWSTWVLNSYIWFSLQTLMSLNLSHYYVRLIILLNIYALSPMLIVMFFPWQMQRLVFKNKVLVVS